MPILKFFPYESFYIVSKLEPDVVQARLQNEITFNDKGFDRNANKFSEPDTHFLGFAGKHKFNIRPYVSYGNWLLPKIKGVIESHNGGGSLVRIKATLPAITNTLVSVWMGILCFACMGFAIAALHIITYKGLGHYIGNFNLLTLIPFVVLILTHILVTVAFKHESRKARNILLLMFDGQLHKKPQ